MLSSNPFPGLAERRHQALVAANPTAADHAIFVLRDCRKLCGTGWAATPNDTTSRARQQAIFLAGSLSDLLRSGKHLRQFKYNDMGRLVVLAGYAAYGRMGQHGFLRGAMFKGWLAHMAHSALNHRMQQLDMNGPVRGSLGWLVDELTHLAGPRIGLH